MGSYVPNTLEERKKMLQEIGYSSIEDLFAHYSGRSKIKRRTGIFRMESQRFEVRREMEQIAEKNQVFQDDLPRSRSLQTFYPGNGKKCDIQRKPVDGIYPISGRNQSGILQSIFEYQTMICDLTGMDVSNASVYDCASGGRRCYDNVRTERDIKH